MRLTKREQYRKWRAGLLADPVRYARWKRHHNTEQEHWRRANLAKVAAMHRRWRARPENKAKCRALKRAWDLRNMFTPEYRAHRNAYMRARRADLNQQKRALMHALTDAEDAYKMSFGIESRMRWRKTIIELRANIHKIKI